MATSDMYCMCQSVKAKTWCNSNNRQRNAVMLGHRNVQSTVTVFLDCLHTKTGTYDTMTTTCNSCANSLNQFCTTISTIICFRHRFQLLTTLSSKHYTPSSLLCTLHQCQNLLVFRQNTLLFKWQNVHFQGCCAIWNQSLSNIRATGERHTRWYFPCCLARENIACDVDEVLWPDRNQRQDEA